MFKLEVVIVNLKHIVFVWRVHTALLELALHHFDPELWIYQAFGDCVPVTVIIKDITLVNIIIITLGVMHQNIIWLGEG